ncbi:MAG: phosphodiesterase [Ruminococcaceae bacterium]|nr:phosphodiesterase [Oscillospiraceae bacterium]
MKILIASDIHGDAQSCAALLSLFDTHKPDLLLLLGDLLYHGPRNPIPEHYDPKQVAELLSAHREHILCVRGNCDGEVDQMMLDFPILSETAMLFVDGKVWMAAHGHRKGANPTENDLPALPYGGVFLSGHTHVPVDEVDENGIRRINPGSVTFPKGGSEKQCVLYENGHFTSLFIE